MNIILMLLLQIAFFIVAYLIGKSAERSRCAEVIIDARNEASRVQASSMSTPPQKSNAKAVSTAMSDLLDEIGYEETFDRKGAA